MLKCYVYNFTHLIDIKSFTAQITFKIKYSRVNLSKAGKIGLLAVLDLNRRKNKILEA